MDHPGLRRNIRAVRKRRRHGVVKTFRPRSAHLRARAESVEHVEEDEAGESHGGVPRSDHVVLQLKNTSTNIPAADALRLSSVSTLNLHKTDRK